MTGPDEGTTPPRAPQARAGEPRTAGPASTRGAAPRPGGADAPGDLGPDVLAPREEALIESAVTALGQRGRGPVIVTALVVGAFLLGLFRPWDLLGPPGAIPAVETAPLAEATAGDGVPVAAESFAAAQQSAPPVPRAAPRTAITCALPSQWRSSSIEDWTGRQARVWKAVEVVEATGPDDPSIPFEPIVSPTITAIGWCAPVDGPDRPPQNLTASLYRIRDGAALPLLYDRLEPREPDVLGELWVPRPLSVGNRPSWPVGRYVIELRSASGGYVRYLGLDLLDHIDRASPAP